MATPVRAKLLLAATILSSLALTACAGKSVRLEPLPAELTTCAEEPAPPDLPPQDWALAIEAIQQNQRTRDRLTLDYALALRGAWGDCKAKVDGVKAWNERVGR